MTYKFIMIFSGICTALLTILRTIIVFSFTETTNGLPNGNSTVIYVIFLILSVICCLAMLYVGKSTVRVPYGPVYKSKICSIAAFLTAAGMVVSFMCSLSTITAMTVVEAIFWLSAAAVYVCIGVAIWGDYEMPPIVYIIPPSCFIINLLSVFIRFSGLVVTIGMIVKFASISMTILFLLSFGKMNTGVKEEKNKKAIFPIGLVTTMLIIVTVIPELLGIFFGKSGAVPEFTPNDITLFLNGIFILTYILKLYSKDNISRKFKYPLDSGYLKENELFSEVIESSRPKKERNHGTEGTESDGEEKE